MSESLFWYTGTVGGWLTIIAVTLFAMALAVACAVFLLSSLSKNYIALLLCVVPATAAFITLSYEGITGSLRALGRQHASLKCPGARRLSAGCCWGLAGR